MPSSSPRRIIPAGCGAVARRLYVPALRALQDAGPVRVSAIVDPSVNAREAVARSFPRAGQADALAIVASPPRSSRFGGDAQSTATRRTEQPIRCPKPAARKTLPSALSPTSATDGSRE
jgi:hypothetical protein